MNAKISVYNSMSLVTQELKPEQICRTCLSREIELYSVFDVYAESTLDFAISSVTGIKIREDDGLPAKICSYCKIKATAAFEFKKKTEESDLALRELLQKKSDTMCKAEVDNYQVSIGIKTERIVDIEYEDDNFSYDMHNDDYTLAEIKKEESIKKARQKCIKVELEDDINTFCPLCGMAYIDAGTLTAHMWQKHPEIMGPKKRGRPKKMLNSTIINKLSENGVQTKPLSVPDEVPVKSYYDCKFCKLMGFTSKELLEHMAEHKDTKVLCCILCKKMYLKKDKFDVHECLNEDKSDRNKDALLDQSTATNSFMTELLLHDILDSESKMENITIIQVCNICSMVLLSKTDLHNHIDSDHPDDSTRCNRCLKFFATAKSAQRHRAVCKNVERKYACGTCGLKFAFEISLNKHILRFHEGQNVSVKFLQNNRHLPGKFECDTCSRTFFRKDSLMKHALMHAEKSFECDICKKKFSRKDNLRSHTKIHDLNREKSPNSHLCLYCGRSFSNSSNLIVHMRRHTGEKPYKCDFCEKGFPRSSDLQCHRRTHTGEKPCKCVVCGKGFSRSNKLSRHMRVHTGVRPYKCTYCDKAFSQSNDLTLHIRRHTGDKPYICEVCGDRFIQGTALQNHRRAHGHFPASAPEAQVPPSCATYTVPLFTGTH